MLVEVGKIREYAQATGATAPEYFAGVGSPIPPTFLASVVFWEDLTTVFDTPAALEAFAAAGIEADVTRLLSLAQEYEFVGAYPKAGDELATALRFDRVETKQGRAGAMVLVHFSIDFTDAGGTLVAVARYTSAYLGQAPAQSSSESARPAPAAPVVEGEVLPERTFGPLTITDVVRYQGASGDFNPMHHDDAMARAAGYPSAFSVGMLGAANLATYCVDLFGLESLARFRTEFRGLVFPGDTLTASGRLLTEDSTRRLRLTLVNDSGDVVIAADADLR